MQPNTLKGLTKFDFQVLAVGCCQEGHPECKVNAKSKVQALVAWQTADPGRPLLCMIDLRRFLSLSHYCEFRSLLYKCYNNLRCLCVQDTLSHLFVMLIICFILIEKNCCYLASFPRETQHGDEDGIIIRICLCALNRYSGPERF